jgi:hypothetical protein
MLFFIIHFFLQVLCIALLSYYYEKILTLIIYLNMSLASYYIKILKFFNFLFNVHYYMMSGSMRHEGTDSYLKLKDNFLLPYFNNSYCDSLNVNYIFNVLTVRLFIKDKLKI